jgi:hypothetical protein
MSTTLPLDGLRSVAASDIPPGTFFCTFESPTGKRGFFLRVDLEGTEHGGMGVINLNGEAPYSFEKWSGGDVQRRSLALPSANLQLQLDMQELPAKDDVSRPGNLLLTAEQPLMIVDARRAGANGIGYVSIADGRLSLDRIEPCACFPKWKLLSRSDHGVDVLVMQIGGD